MKSDSGKLPAGDRVKSVPYAVHLVMNECTNDARVLRAARAASLACDHVTVLAQHRGDLPLREFRNGFKILRLGIRTQNWPRLLPFQLIKYVELCLRMITAGSGIRPNVIHAHDLMTLIPGWVIAWISGARLIYDSHELWSEIHNLLAWPAPVRWTAIKLETVLARRADRIVTVCDSIADEIQQRMDTPRRPTVVRNIPESPRTAPQTRSDGTLRRTHGLQASDQIMLYIGWFSPHRGLELLINALPLLPDHVHLVLLGKGMLLERLKELSQQLKVSERVHFHGVVPPDQVLGLSCEATIGVVPYEGVTLNQKYCLPNKVFEYVQAGVPLLVSDLPELSRFVSEQKIGKVFRDGSAEDLARQAAACLDSTEELDRIRERLIAIRDQFCWASESQRIVSLYEDLRAA